jgi:hypothetical protein
MRQNCVTIQFTASNFHRILLVSLIKEDQVGGICSTHGKGEKFVQGLGWEVRKEETTRKT